MQVNATTPAARFEVTCDMSGLTSRAGTALLSRLADRIGLTDALVAALSMHDRTVRHEPGRIVRDICVMLADGGDALTDLGALRDQGVLFGSVASDATAYRCVERLDEGMLSGLRRARAAARARVWGLAGAPERTVLDIDATLVTAHSDKEGAAGTYKGGYGFHPLVCFEATTGEGLASILRPGNAGSNTAADHIEVLARALSQLPEGTLNRGTLVRCDSGGATHAFLSAVAAAGLSFSVGFDLTEHVREACLAVPEAAWSSALDADGHRFQVFLTNQTGARIARLEQVHRARAVVEDHIRCAKASGLRNLPFRSFSMNDAWLELVLLGCDLVAWTRMLLLEGTKLAACEPKRLRYRLMHVAGRIACHARGVKLRLPRSWPWAGALAAAFARLQALPSG